MEVKNYQFVVLDCTMEDNGIRSKSCCILKEAGFRVIRATQKGFEESFDPLSSACVSRRVIKLFKRYKPDVVIIHGFFQKGNFSWRSDDVFAGLRSVDSKVVIVQSWNIEQNSDRSECPDLVDAVLFKGSFINNEDYRNEMIYKLKSLVLKKKLAEGPSTCIVSDG